MSASITSTCSRSAARGLPPRSSRSARGRARWRDSRREPRGFPDRRPRPARRDLRATARRRRGRREPANARSARACSEIIGSWTVNVVPSPSPSLCALTLPPCASTSCRTIDSPSPRPPYARRVDPSAWVNGSNMCGRNSGRIPTPSSLTVSSAMLSPTRRSPRRTWPPDGRELDGVRQQVPRNLLQPPAIAVNGSDRGLQRGVDVHALRLGRHLHDVHARRGPPARDSRRNAPAEASPT